jgi:hypothetical protein
LNRPVGDVGISQHILEVCNSLIFCSDISVANKTNKARAVYQVYDKFCVIKADWAQLEPICIDNFHLSGNFYG